MIAVRISPDQRVVVVGVPVLFARRGKPAHPRDLHDHDCISLRMVTSGSVGRWKFVENGKDLEIAVEGHVVTNDGAVLVDAAAEGIGLAYVFENMVSTLVSEKRLVRVLDKYCPQIPGYFLYYPSRVNLAPKLKVLIDFLRKRSSHEGSCDEQKATDRELCLAAPLTGFRRSRWSFGAPRAGSLGLEFGHSVASDRGWRSCRGGAHSQAMRRAEVSPRAFLPRAGTTYRLLSRCAMNGSLFAKR